MSDRILSSTFPIFEGSVGSGAGVGTGTGCARAAAKAASKSGSAVVTTGEACVPAEDGSKARLRSDATSGFMVTRGGGVRRRIRAGCGSRRAAAGTVTVSSFRSARSGTADGNCGSKLGGGGGAMNGIVTDGSVGDGLSIARGSATISGTFVSRPGRAASRGGKVGSRSGKGGSRGGGGGKIGAASTGSSSGTASSAANRAEGLRLMLRSTTTSLGPPTRRRCSTLSRRSRMSWRCRSSS